MVVVSCLVMAVTVYAQEAQVVENKGELSEIKKGDKLFELARDEID